MIITSTHSIEGDEITAYLGVVAGEAIVGANILRDFLASVTDVTGGRSLSFQNALREARTHAMNDMKKLARDIGANAVVGVDIDYEVLGTTNGMLLVGCNGTAVRLASGGAVPASGPIDPNEDPGTYENLGKTHF